MKNKKVSPQFFLLVACGLSGVATAAANRPASNQAGSNTQQTAPAAVSDKTAKKISQAIGEEVEDFVVTAQEEIEAPAGFTGTQYTIATDGGKKYKCEILEPSKAGKIMSWGMGSGASAMCTEFAGTGRGKPSPSNRDPAPRKPAAAAGNPAKQAAAVAVNDKAAKKISQAIGEDVEDFVVTAQEEIEAPAGFTGTQYTIATDGGKKYKCEILEPSKAGKIMSWGMGSGASAMCTEFAGTGRGKPSPSNRDPAPRKPAAAAGNPAKQAAAVAVNDKAAKKISQAIGE